VLLDGLVPCVIGPHECEDLRNPPKLRGTKIAAVLLGSLTSSKQLHRPQCVGRLFKALMSHIETIVGAVFCS
jgi:hypothetical protein